MINIIDISDKFRAFVLKEADIKISHFIYLGKDGNITEDTQVVYNVSVFINMEEFTFLSGDFIVHMSDDFIGKDTDYFKDSDDFRQFVVAEMI